jgi:hypothetical protein
MLQPRPPEVAACSADSFCWPLAFLDPREGWIPRELDLARSQWCLGDLMKTKCETGSAPVSASGQGLGLL